MSHKTAATVAHTIGIDTGKNTLHLVGLDDKRAIVLREKVARDRITVRLANMPQERLQRCPRDRGSCSAAVHTLRSGEDRRST